MVIILTEFLQRSKQFPHYFDKEKNIIQVISTLEIEGPDMDGVDVIKKYETELCGMYTLAYTKMTKKLVKKY